MKHIFTFTNEIWSGFDLPEIRATAELLKKYDLYRLPFDDVVYLQTPHEAPNKLILDGKYDHDPAFDKNPWREIMEIRLDRDDEPLAIIRHIPFRGREAARAEARKAVSKCIERIKGLEAAIEDCKWLKDGSPIPVVKGFNTPANVAEAIRWYSQCLADEKKDQTQAQQNIFLINREGISRASGPSYETVVAPMFGGEGFRDTFRDVLIVMLRSRGTVKSVSERRPPSAGPGANNDIEVITRISLAPSASGPGLGGSHASPRMHMRRGHEHTFRCGPGKTQTVTKFIDAIWVNEDAEFEAVRKEYKFVPAD